MQQQVYPGQQQQWQQGQPQGGPGAPDPMGSFQPSSTPGQRILAAAGLLSGGQQGTSGVPPQDPAAQTQAALLAGQLDDATLLRLLQERAAQGSFQGQQQQQQQQQHQQQPFSPQQQLNPPQMNPPPMQSQQFVGSPPQGGSGFGFSGQAQSQISPPPGMMSGGNQSGQGGSTQSKPKTRARRGQATDPHSIAERLRRERIAERMRALQELVPNSNKVDKASMLDDIIEYVKFLQLQVKVLNLNRLSGPAADAVASLLSDLDPNVGEDAKISMTPQELELTERQVALLMEQDMGMAMQYLQSKGLCLMPTALANMMNKGKGPKPIATLMDSNNCAGQEEGGGDNKGEQMTERQDGGGGVGGGGASQVKMEDGVSDDLAMGETGA